MEISIMEAVKLTLPQLSSKQQEQLCAYYKMLIEWNERMNLTAITAPAEAATKHFADSILPMELIPIGASCIDVGTGAGFPGIPLMIARPDISMILLDSLQKRIMFLKAVCETLGLEAKCVHARAEDAARLPEYREKIDCALSRAVAPANILLEYTVPFIKVGGKSLMYKGAAGRQELMGCDEALSKLACTAQIHVFDAAWGQRSVIAATKRFATAPAYPRRSAAINKKPL